MTLEELGKRHEQEWETFIAEYKAARERRLVTEYLSIAVGKLHASKQEDVLKSIDTWCAYWGVNGVLVNSIKEKHEKEWNEFFEREKLIDELNKAQALLKGKDKGEREI